MEELQALEEGAFNEDTLSRKQEIVAKIEKVLLEKTSWKQNSKVL